MSTGDQSYTAAMRLIANDTQSNDDVQSLLLKAINDGLSKSSDECMAYAYLGSSYSDNSDFTRSLKFYRKSFLLRRSLSQSIIQEWENDEIMRGFWQNMKNKFGISLCIIGGRLEDDDKYSNALQSYDEAVEYTDHSLAHQKLVRLHEILYSALHKKKDLDAAISHAEYIINNGKLLEHFPKYQETLLFAKEAREQFRILEKKSSSSMTIKIIFAIVVLIGIILLSTKT